jgi:hypothetical protein
MLRRLIILPFTMYPGLYSSASVYPINHPAAQPDTTAGSTTRFVLFIETRLLVSQLFLVDITTNMLVPLLTKNDIPAHLLPYPPILARILARLRVLPWILPSSVAHKLRRIASS